MKSIYPAVFYQEQKGYSVEFPDLPGCCTEGDDLVEAIEMAEEALGAYLASRLDNDLSIAPASKIEDLEEKGGFTSYICADPARFRKKGKSIKKTLTVPEWLNVEAEKAGINFSAVLQDAIRVKLGI